MGIRQALSLLSHIPSPPRGILRTFKELLTIPHLSASITAHMASVAIFRVSTGESIYPPNPQPRRCLGSPQGVKEERIMNVQTWQKQEVRENREPRRKWVDRTTTSGTASGDRDSLMWQF